MTRLLIVGATGMVGQEVLDRALADPLVAHVVALTRRPVPPREGMENVVVDFDALPAEAPWWCVDGVVCALGTTRAKTGDPAQYRRIDHDYPLAVARHARDHGATRYALTSSLGADARSHFAYSRLKGELEDALATVGYPSLTIVRPSILGGDRTEHRPGERFWLEAFRLLGLLLPRRLRISPAGAVAQALLDGAVAGLPGVHVLHNEEMR